MTRMTREQKEELLHLMPEGRVLFDEPMLRHSTIGIGGPAEAFVLIEDIEDLKRIVGWAMERTIDYRIWGGGSNTLVRDGGIRGLVISLGSAFGAISVERTSGDDVFVSVGASTPTHKLMNWCLEKGLSGIEMLSGCWGTVGGNLVMNAGTGGASISDAVEEITIVDREGRELTMKKAALRFEYRSLKLPKTMIIIRALLKLKQSSAEDVKAKVDERTKHRKKVQPMGVRSLGCVFKNPGKTSAGLLIDEAGFKGVRVGGARVSAVHANFIINEGKATARDMVVLMNLIRERVKDQTGTVLEPEIIVIGEE